MSWMKKQEKTKPKSKLASFFERRAARGVLGLLALLLAYAFASWAVDTGSLLDYAITLLLIFIGVRESVAALRGPGKASGR